MTELITNRVLEFMARYHKIENTQLEIYKYGIHLILSDLSNFLTILIPSIFLNKLNVGVLFITIFCLIRRYSGGYHCSTSLRCNLTYLTIYIILLILLQQSNLYHNKTIDLLYYLSAIFIILLAPISRNKIFNNNTTIKNKLLTILGVVMTILLKNIVLLEYTFVMKYVVIVIFLLMIVELLYRRWKDEFNF